MHGLESKQNIQIFQGNKLTAISAGTRTGLDAIGHPACAARLERFGRDVATQASDLLVHDPLRFPPPVFLALLALAVTVTTAFALLIASQIAILDPTWIIIIVVVHVARTYVLRSTAVIRRFVGFRGTLGSAGSR